MANSREWGFELRAASHELCLFFGKANGFRQISFMLAARSSKPLKAVLK
jgi:hypothetical protein